MRITPWLGLVRRLLFLLDLFTTMPTPSILPLRRLAYAELCRDPE